MGTCQFEARDRHTPIHATGANDDLVRLQPKPALGFDRVRVGEARRAGLLMHGHSERIDLRP